LYSAAYYFWHHSCSLQSRAADIFFTLSKGLNIEITLSHSLTMFHQPNSLFAFSSQEVFWRTEGSCGVGNITTITKNAEHASMQSISEA